MKRLIRAVLKNVGVWGLVLLTHRTYRLFRKLCYSIAVFLRLGFAVQLKLLPPQFLERPVLVKPAKITRRLINPGMRAYRPVSDGDWDFRAEPIIPGFLNTIHFKLMYEMFVDHLPIRETGQYIKMEQEILTTGETVDHSFHSIEEVVQHLEEYEQLFSELRETGYKSQEELGNPRFLHEMKICIGRDGEPMYLTQGTHRLAMAKILGLTTVSVGVWTVHEFWARRCFEKYGGGVLESIYKGLQDLDSYTQGSTITTKDIEPPEPESEITYKSVEAETSDSAALDNEEL